MKYYVLTLILIAIFYVLSAVALIGMRAPAADMRYFIYRPSFIPQGFLYWYAWPVYKPLQSMGFINKHIKDGYLYMGFNTYDP